ncbi:hypothetical protein H5410_032142 [Solanum commersonii]|uniref:Secreted protein n=1 Tax=Solanum commersonii TaxID=4109 RepID=A0A9J5YNS8_SOLCO|nr:hypothetical protein H5410_032142 [Solanum commersonii]
MVNHACLVLILTLTLSSRSSYFVMLFLELRVYQEHALYLYEVGITTCGGGGIVCPTENFHLQLITDSFQ